MDMRRPMWGQHPARSGGPCPMVAMPWSSRRGLCVAIALAMTSACGSSAKRTEVPPEPEENLENLVCEAPQEPEGGQEATPPACEGDLAASTWCKYTYATAVGAACPPSTVSSICVRCDGRTSCSTSNVALVAVNDQGVECKFLRPAPITAQCTRLCRGQWRYKFKSP